jgi:tetratricopeptide (TPR) repeat protein
MNRAALFLLVTAALAQAQQPPAVGMVDLRASDGTVLKASFFAAAKPGPGLLLFHQVNRTRKSWDDLAPLLAAAGIHTLTLDIRGFGESGGPHHGRQTDASDVDTAFEYLVSQPGVKRDVIGAGGAGWLGVDDAVVAGKRHPNEVKSLALLSGETLQDGLQFLRQASQLPGLFVVADDDEYPPSVDAMELLYITSSNPGKKFIHYASAEEAPWLGYEEEKGLPAAGGHGTDLFKVHSELPGIIVNWFVNTLIKTPGHAPADTEASAAILDQIRMPGGVAQVRQQLLEARRKDRDAQLFPEIALNIIGQDHLRAGEPKPAVEVFELNLLAYPDCADAEDDLADAYFADGQKDLARQHAEKALALLDSHGVPASSWSDTVERRGIIRKDAQEILQKLSASATSQASPQAPAPLRNEIPPAVRSRADETLEWWNHIGNKLIAMAKDFPEDKYDFKLQKEERTFAENLLHIAAVDYDLISRVAGSKMGPDFGKDKHNPPREAYKTKADVVKLIEQAIADGAAVIARQGDAGLDQTQQFGWETGRHVVHNSYLWIAAIEHSAEHFGQLVVYYRANNLVPPESR